MREFVRVIVVKDNKYLLIREDKKNWFNGWIFPGGKVESGETSENAALRELKEEINLDVDKDKLNLWYQANSHFDSGDWRGYYFICKDCNLDKLKIMEPNKCNGYCFFNFDELKKINLVVPKDVVSQLEVYHCQQK